MIKREFYDRCKYLISLNRMTFSEVKEVETILQTNVNKSYSVCVKCRAQIKHAQVLLNNWLSSQEVIEDVIESIEPLEEPILVKEMVYEVEVDEEEADRVGCLKCKRKSKDPVTTTKTTRKPRTKK